MITERQSRFRFRQDAPDERPAGHGAGLGRLQALQGFPGETGFRQVAVEKAQVMDLNELAATAAVAVGLALRKAGDR